MKQQLQDKSNDRYTNIKNVIYKDYQWESNDRRENKKISSSSSEKEKSRSSNSDSEKKLNHKNKINFWIKKQNQLIWK